MSTNQPHRSTTTPELFYHIKEAFTDSKGKTYKAGTVFLRQDGGDWFASVARCSVSDNFCRRTGRTVARRRWFNSGPWYDAVTPSHEEAVRIYKSI